MRVLSAILAFIAAILAVSAPAPAVPPEVAAEAPASKEMLLAGDSGGLWLVLGDEQRRTFAIIHKPSGEQWRWSRHGLTGEPAAAVAAGGQLHLLFKSGGYHIYGIAVDRAGAKLPGRLLAACPAGSGAKEGSSVLAVVVDTAPPPQRSDQAAPAGAETTTELTRLTLHRNAGNSWPVTAELKNVRLGPEDRVFVAAVGAKVYLLVCAASGEPEALWTLADGVWTLTKPAGELARAKVLAMLAVDGRAVIVLETPAPTGRALRLAFADDPAASLVEPDLQQTVPQDAPAPLAAPGGERRIAMLWRDGATLRAVSCDLSGKSFPLQDVSLLNRPPGDGRGEVFLQYVLWLVMLAIFVIMFLPGRRPAAGPLVLPVSARPANLLKRVVAVLIDMMLASILAAPLVPELPRDLDVLMELMRQAPTPNNVIYANLIVMGIYTSYSIIMEWRYGATLGKMLFKMRVVGDHGKRPGVREILLRNLSRLIPLVAGYLLPLLVLFPLLNPARQRLGDMLARTVVLDARSLPPPGPPSQADQAQPPSEPTD